MNARAGLSLTECAAIVVVVALGLQMLLPAIQMSREAARRGHCASNLRDLGMGTCLYEREHNAFPSGGWGPRWVGSPDRGIGPSQPGSWGYSALGYVGRQDLRDLGRNCKGDELRRALAQVCQTAIPIFNCPTRREATVFDRYITGQPLTSDGSTRLPIRKVARADYAINTGDIGVGQPSETDMNQVAPTIPDGDSPAFVWYETKHLNGLSFGRSQVVRRQVLDGLSKTYLIGEKYLPKHAVNNGTNCGDDESMYSGFDNDNGRSAENVPQFDDIAMEMSGAFEVSMSSAFGSSHDGIWQAVFGDGSVHSLSFNIDANIHKSLANREDGTPLRLTRNRQFIME